jgi:hypothetical protein
MSSKTLTRSESHQVRQLLMSRRWYSVTPSDPSKPEDGVEVEVEGSKEAVNGETKPDSELASKLKAKEAEVVDLTVCLS